MPSFIWMAIKSFYISMNMDVEHSLLAEYQKGLPRKIDLLRQLTAGVKKERSLSSLEALHFEVHKIAGNSGTYGYKSASDLCRQLSMDLMEKIKSFSPASISDEWLSSLNLFLQKLEIAFSAPDTKFDIYGISDCNRKS
jgi:HPt (histidine-containing phosphotransfer) domain-containing protein